MYSFFVSFFFFANNRNNFKSQYSALFGTDLGSAFNITNICMYNMSYIQQFFSQKPPELTVSLKNFQNIYTNVL